MALTWATRVLQAEWGATTRTDFYTHAVPGLLVLSKTCRTDSAWFHAPILIVVLILDSGGHS